MNYYPASRYAGAERSSRLRKAFIAQAGLSQVGPLVLVLLHYFVRWGSVG
jgi:hypothetical protein